MQNTCPRLSRCEARVQLSPAQKQPVTIPEYAGDALSGGLQDMLRG